MKKYTQEYYYNEILKALPESRFRFEKYTGAEDPCTITCLNCNRTYDFSKARLIKRRASRGNKNVCRYCEENDWTKRQLLAEQKAKYMLQKKGSIILVSDIKSWASREPCIWHCKKCDHNFERSPFVMFSQNSLNCPWCETHPYEYTDEMLIEESATLWGTEYSILDTKCQRESNGSKRILVCHNKCGFKYEVNAYKFLHGQGCPKCKSSHGEWKVRKYLEAHNFIFQEQYSIHTNVNQWLKLDFYLEHNNHKIAIEYNGIQHYQPVEYFNGIIGFNAQQERDKIKKEYCDQNNIELIIIPYNDESLINSEKLAQRLSGQVAEEYPS